MIDKYKNEIIFTIFIVLFAIAFYYLYVMVLPFLIGITLAFKCLPTIVRICRFIGNRTLATSLYLAGITTTLILFFILIAGYINRDFNRLRNSFQVVASQNKYKLDATAEKIKSFASKVYNINNLETDLLTQADSLKSIAFAKGGSGIDTKAIEDSFKAITSVFQQETKPASTEKSGFGFMFILIMTIGYYVLALFNIDYFDSIRKRYFGGRVEAKYQLIINDLNQSFVRYFALRTKIVLWLSLIYLTVFFIMDLPGFILITIFILILSYIPYIQYIMLVPVAIACLPLSIEGNHGFLFYYGIATGVFVLASIIEEMVLNPLIMEKNMGMNPAIMVLALSVWGYAMGIPGLLVAIPLTSLILIYVKRYFLGSYMKLNE
ncbi:MAG: AI-2E family transporter [Mariniphaga sp.]